MSEHRGSRRAKVLKSAKISFGGAAVSCSLRNLTEAGALLDVESPLGIPPEFTLVIPSDGMPLSCRVFWRPGHRMSVRFGENVMRQNRSVNSVSRHRGRPRSGRTYEFGKRAGHSMRA